MKALKTKGLKLTYSSGNIITYFIFNGKNWTPFDSCVDHGDYYEISKHSFYIRINKATMQVTSNYKDPDRFDVYDRFTAEIVQLTPEQQEYAVTLNI